MMRNFTFFFFVMIPVFCSAVIRKDVDISPGVNDEYLVSLSLSASEQVSCPGESDGSATFLIVDLLSLNSYDYVVKNSQNQQVSSGSASGLLDLVGTLTELTFTVDDLAAGAYELDITFDRFILGDVTQEISFVIDEPDPIEVSLNIIDVTCLDPVGSIEIISSGGTGGLDLGFLGDLIELTGVNDVLTDLGAGLHSLTVSDANGCTQVVEAEVQNLIELPDLNVSADLTIGCNQLLDLDASTSNGIALTWESPDGHIVGSVIGNSVQVDVPGIYIATALDPLSGCISRDSVDVSLEVNIPQIDVIGNLDLGCKDVLDLNISSDAGLGISWSTINGEIDSALPENGIRVTAPGVYICAALDLVTGCTNADTVEVVANLVPPAITLSGDLNLGCHDILDLGVSTSGNESISWSTTNGNIIGNLSGNNIQVTAPGIYLVTALDLLTGCETTEQVEVVADVNLPNIEIDGLLDLGCNEVLDLNASTSSGVSLEWSTENGNILGNANVASIEIGAPGVYVLTATDLITGCENSEQVEVIADIDLPIINVLTDLELTIGCNNILDLSVSADPGTPVSWLTLDGNILGNNSGQSIQVDKAGTYLATAIDLNSGCSSTVEVDVILDLSVPTLDLGEDRTIGCLESILIDAQTDASILSWSAISGLIDGVTNGTSVEVLGPGTYVAVAVDPLSGCETSDTIQILPDVSDKEIDLGVDLTLNCLGVLDLVAINADNLDLQWTTLGGNILNELGNNMVKIDAPGVYIASAVDAASGCLISDTISVELQVSVDQPELRDTAFLDCSGVATISIENGLSASVSLNWIDIGIGATLDEDGTTLEVSAPGTYAIVSTDLLTGCSSRDTVEVLPSPSLLMTSAIQNPLCHGGMGSIVVQMIEGVPPFSYEWENGDDDNELEAVPAGSYALSVTDALGCVGEYVITLFDPEGMHAEVLTEENQDGTFYVEVMVEGGLAPYQMTWPNGDTGAILSAAPAGSYAVEIYDANQCFLLFEFDLSTDSIDICDLHPVVEVGLLENNLAVVQPYIYGGVAPYSFAWSTGEDGDSIVVPPGNYSLTVEDAVGCSQTIAFTVFEDIDKTCDLNLSLSYSYLPNGSANVTANISGGKAPYEILWSDGSSATTNILGPGEHKIFVTDAIGCARQETINIDSIDHPDGCNLSLLIQSSNGSGVNGTASLTVQNGSAPYEYTWTTGETTSQISGLSAGLYTVSVIDANGCTGSATVEITEPQCSLDVNLNIRYISEGIAEVTAEVIGGPSTYVYSWSNGLSGATNVFSPGTYSVIVFDSAQCEGQASFTIVEPPVIPNSDCDLSLSINWTTNDVNSTSATVFVLGGTGPYTFEWSTGETGATIEGIAAGIYSVVVTDAAGCIASVTRRLPNEEDPEIPSSCPNDIVVRECNTQVFYPVSESGEDLKIRLIEGLPSGSIFPTGTTRVTFLITDASGSCQLCSFNVIVGSGELMVEVTSPSCFGSADGTATVTLDSESSDFCLFWSNTEGQTGTEATGLQGGTYLLTGVSASGCVLSKEVVIQEPAPLELMYAMTMNSNAGSDNGQIQVSMQGGTYPYSYMWTGPNGFMSDLEDLYEIASGVYSLVVKDAKGCTFELSDLEVGEDVPTDPGSGFIAQSASVYPNPNQGQFNLKFVMEESQDIDIAIYNSLGEILTERHFDEVHKTTVNVQLEKFTPGVHFLHIRGTMGLITKKITLY